MCVCVCVCAKTIKEKVAINLTDNERTFKGGFGGWKWKGKIIF